MSDKKYDVAIIGGGLAGLSLSILLAKKGFKVAVFEKKSYPFHKVCGEYISMESWNFVEDLGINLQEEGAAIINKLQISSNNKLIETDLGLGGFGISRYVLDNLLAQKAKAAGVSVYEECSVSAIEQGEIENTFIAKGQQFSARLLIGAFGKKSKLDVEMKRSFLRSKASKYIAFKYHARIPDFDEQRIELHLFKGGYCGISKIEEDKYCICYMCKESLGAAYNNLPKQLETNILHSNPHLAGRLAQAEIIYQRPLAISQISFKPKTKSEGQMLMIGDAAGLIAPLCGNGMSVAFHSAKLLAPLCSAYLQGQLSINQVKTNYHNAWKKHFKLRFVLGLCLQKIISFPLLAGLLIYLLGPSKKLTQKLISYTHGAPF